MIFVHIYIYICICDDSRGYPMFIHCYSPQMIHGWPAKASRRCFWNLPHGNGDAKARFIERGKEPLRAAARKRAAKFAVRKNVWETLLASNWQSVCVCVHTYIYIYIVIYTNICIYIYIYLIFRFMQSRKTLYIHIHSCNTICREVWLHIFAFFKMGSACPTGRSLFAFRSLGWKSWIFEFSKHGKSQHTPATHFSVEFVQQNPSQWESEMLEDAWRWFIVGPKHRSKSTVNKKKEKQKTPSVHPNFVHSLAKTHKFSDMFPENLY